MVNAELDDWGNPINDPNADPYALDPATSRSTLVNGVSNPETPQPKDSGAVPGSLANDVITRPSPTPNDPGNTTPPVATQPAASASFAQGQTYTQNQIPGLVQLDPGLFGDNQGHFFDSSGTYRGGDTKWFYGTPQKQPAPTPTPTTPTSTLTPEPGPGLQVNAPAATTGNTATTAPAFNTQMRDLLLSQLKGLSDPTTADSPDTAPAISAYNTQSQRDQQEERDALAERFYASGGAGSGASALDSGGFNTAVQKGIETAAGNRANFTGSTVYNAAQAKRQQLQTMLQTATTAGLTDSAQQIQRQIALIDAKLREQGLTQQNSQFTQSQGQQDQQYYDGLARQYAELQAQTNRDTLLAGLRG